MGWKTLLTEEKDGVYVVKLNRPMKKNAYNFDMYEEVIKALKEAEQSPTARVAVRPTDSVFFCLTHLIFLR